ncbi:hypothetical protein [Streptomyces sp. NPDC058985]
MLRGALLRGALLRGALLRGALLRAACLALPASRRLLRAGPASRHPA